MASSKNSDSKRVPKIATRIRVNPEPGKHNNKEKSGNRQANPTCHIWIISKLNKKYNVTD